MAIVFLFPGQGSQKLGMGKALAEAFPAAKAVFEEVDEALHEKLSAIIWGGDAELLNKTENAQPALLAAEIAAFRAAGSPRADFALGHSLGEYPALVAAGSLTLSAAAKLLKLRAEAMAGAAQGTMMAILGLDIEKVRELTGQIEGAWVANDNCPGQVVVSGTKEAMSAMETKAKDSGAKRALVLPVSVPAHCPLMQSAREKIEEALEQTELDTPSIPFISNRTAAPDRLPAEIKKHLAEQMTNGVRFRECAMYAAENGALKLVEFGAGSVLSGLAKRCVENAETASLDTPESIEEFATKL